MNCGYCGTPLPPGALFCVECGRSVGHGDAAPPRPTTPIAPELQAPHCPQCGSPIVEGDIFCGECGFVLRPIAAQPTAPPVPAPSPEPNAEPETESEPEPLPVADPEEAPEPDPDPEPDPRPEDEDDVESAPLPETSFLAPAPLEDIESTRIVASPRRGERYVLQFST
ncbi:zinc ribbon domain-containing protein, partial [Schumannella luteola]